MDDLIFSINRIQDQLRSLNHKLVDLPQIVVVGSQSSGKSSVLESLVRRSFLPRGTGMVTRCPLILRLVNCPRGDKLREDRGVSSDEWGEFGPEETTYKIDEIQSEIERRTAALAGEKKNISSEPIVLKIFSPNVLTLTLVDLPGITKVAVDDQPEDIEKQIVELIYKFIKNPKSIILAVVTANTDMATHECLKMARDVDPEGERTLAVLTKLDLMDKGTNATDILTGRCIPVKLGIIGVVNRSQKDIEDRKSIKDAIYDEEDFLEETYPSLAHINGTAYLAKRLQTLLINHINTCLPDIRASLEQRLKECKDTLKKYGGRIDNCTCFHYLISAVVQLYNEKMKGECVDTESTSMLLKGEAKIGDLFEECEKSLESLMPWEIYWHDRVLFTIKQTSGPEKPLFASDLAFKVLMKPLISTVREPSEECVTQVATEMYAIFTESIKEHFDEHYSNRFPLALKEISELVGQTIENLTNKTLNHINEAIAIEEGHITHRHLRGIVEKFDLQWSKDETLVRWNPFPKDDINAGLTCSLSEIKEVRRVAFMLQVYYKAVANRIADTVAKATMTYMVHGLHKNIQPQLTSQLGGRVKELLREDETTALMRSQKEKELIAIQNSLQELNALNLEVSKKIDLY